MSSHYTVAQLAEGAIKRAIVRMGEKYLFHAKVLEKFRLMAEPSVETLGVTASNGSVQLLYNADFVLSLPRMQLLGALLHEVHHVVFGHLAVDPADYSDGWALTVALEVSVNEFVREPLPPGVILLEQFPMLLPLESFDQRYQRLQQVEDRINLSGLVSSDAGDPAERLGKVLDDHVVWRDARLDPEAVRKALSELLFDAAVQAGGMPAELKAVAENIDVGIRSGNDLRGLRHDHDGKLHWTHLLRRYARRALASRPVFNRAARRFPDLLGIVPGRRHTAAKVSVVAIIDTSASISAECLGEIDGELRQLARSHPVHVVECDSKVQRTYRYHGRLDWVQGGGGTDFRPALAAMLLGPLKPGLVVYFTDGEGEAPEKSPSWPLIWCLTPGGKAPATYGRVIEMVATEKQSPRRCTKMKNICTGNRV